LGDEIKAANRREGKEKDMGLAMKGNKAMIPRDDE
jgi:hypothetical protein